MRFFSFWRKSNSLTCTFFCLKWKTWWFHIILRKPHVREKSSSRDMGQKPSRPIRTLDSWNRYISRTVYGIKLKFCMEVKKDERKQLFEEKNFFAKKRPFFSKKAFRADPRILKNHIKSLCFIGSSRNLVGMLASITGSYGHGLHA